MLNPDNNPDPLAGLYADEDTSDISQENDPLAGLYADESSEQNNDEEKRKKQAGPYFTPEKTPEELRNMPLEEKLQYVKDLKTEQEYIQSKGFTKGALSGLTFGLTENIPGFKPEGEALSTFGEFIGATLPISFLANVYTRPLIALAKKSPILKGALSSLANMTGLTLGGTTFSSLEHIAKEHELPSMNQVLEHGFQWAALDVALRTAGVVGKFAVNMLNLQKKTGKPPFKIINDVYTELREQGIDVGKDKRTGTKALSILEDMNAPKPKKGEVREVNPKKFEEMDNSIQELSEPILPEARQESINVNSMVEDAEQTALRNRIDTVGRRLATETELGEQIQKGITTAREEAKSQYKPFYDEVEEEARYITTTPKSTARIGGDLLILMEELRTKPAGYSTVLKTIENVLEDAGYVIQRAENGAIESIIQESEIPLNRLIEMGRRLNEIVEYDVLDKTVKDRLKPLVTRGVKADIRSALEAADEDLLASWELAEEAFGINAQKFNRKSIRKMRQTQTLEDIPKQVDSATTLNELRDIISPRDMKDVERDILERMNNMSEAKAQDFLRRVQKGLSKDSQEIADQIVRSKRPINKQSIQGRRDRLHETIDNDLADAMNTGKRPSKTLELWQNPRGQKLVREALDTHPQKEQLLEYLQKQTTQDMARSIITPEGEIDFAKLDKLMENPAIRNNLREMGGQEAVDFFNQLEQRANSLKKNAQELGVETLKTKQGMKKGPKEEAPTHEKGKQILRRMAKKDFPLAAGIQQVIDSLGFTGKITLNLFTLLKFGFIKGALIPIAGRVIQRLASSSKARKAFIEASKKHTNPIAFLSAIENLGKEIDEED